MKCKKTHKTMDIKELQQLGDTIREYYELKNNITADRFKWVAMAQGESNENAELLYCVFNELKDGLFVLSNQSLYNAADRRLEYAKKLTKALEIAGQTYQLCGSGKKYSGDIFFLHLNPYDRLFDIWHTDDCGVFLATDRGFVKLLYTQGRGYIDKDGRPNIDEQHRYSNYMLNGTSKIFDIVGNIHKDISVLVDKPQTEEERR